MLIAVMAERIQSCGGVDVQKGIEGMSGTVAGAWRPDDEAGNMARSASVECGWHVSTATQLSSFVIETKLSTFVRGTGLQEVER